MHLELKETNVVIDEAENDGDEKTLKWSRVSKIQNQDT